MALAWAALLGAVVGTVLYDALTAAGLHWLTWPAVAALVLAAVIGTIVRRRKRS
jgi:uncharacterized membrane protein YdjX (TVP38/TMEM64 family)